jgi:hypothetical protein
MVEEWNDGYPTTRDSCTSRSRLCFVPTIPSFQCSIIPALYEPCGAWLSVMRRRFFQTGCMSPFGIPSRATRGSGSSQESACAESCDTRTCRAVCSAPPNPCAAPAARAERKGAGGRVQGTGENPGMMEWWKNGTMGTQQPVIPARDALVCALYPRFHHSNVPLFLHSMNRAGLGSASCVTLSSIPVTRHRTAPNPRNARGRIVTGVRMRGILRHQNLPCRVFGSAEPVCRPSGPCRKKGCRG